MAIESLAAQELAPTVKERLSDMEQVLQQDPWEIVKREDDALFQRNPEGMKVGFVPQESRKGRNQDRFLDLDYRTLHNLSNIDWQTLSKRMIRANEGYKNYVYGDEGKDEDGEDKGTRTAGIGATGEGLEELTNPEAIYRRFYKDFDNHQRAAMKAFGNSWDTIPNVTKAFVLDSYFRGGLHFAPKTRSLMKEGKFFDAGSEFLQGTGPLIGDGPERWNKEYYASKTRTPYTDKNGKVKKPGPGVAIRMERFANHLQSLPVPPVPRGSVRYPGPGDKIREKNLWEDFKTGEYYTEKTRTFGFDGKHWVVPMVDSSRGYVIHSDNVEEAIKLNGRFGPFNTSEEADKFARKRSDNLDKLIREGSTPEERRNTLVRLPRLKAKK